MSSYLWRTKVTSYRKVVTTAKLREKKGATLETRETYVREW